MNVVVGANVPLVSVVRQAQWNVQRSHCGEVRGKRACRVETGILRFHLRDSQKIRGWVRRRRRLLEECVGQTVGEVRLDELDKLLGLDGSHDGTRIRRGESERTNEEKHLVAKDRAAEGAAIFIATKRRECAATRGIRRARRL